MSGNRYIILILIPLIFFFTLNCSKVSEWDKGEGSKRWKFYGFVILIILFILFSSVPVFKQAGKVSPVMNDAWVGLGSFMQYEADRGIPVVVWWDWGYNVKYLTELPVYSDGGTQTKAETYLVSKVFMSDVEESLNVLRLLSCGSDYPNYNLYDVQSIFNTKHLPCLGKTYLLFYYEMAYSVPYIASIANYDFISESFPTRADINSSIYSRLAVRNETLDNYNLLLENNYFKLYEVIL